MKQLLKRIVFFLFISSVTAFAEYNDFKIISETDNQILIEFTPQNWQTSEEQAATTIYTNLSFDQAGFINFPGEPELPSRIVTLGVPLQGNVQAQLLDAETVTLNNIQLRTVSPVIPVEKEADDSNIHIPNAQTANIIVSRDPVVLGLPVMFRSQRIVKLILNPVQYDSGRKQVVRYDKIRVLVTYSNGAAANANTITAAANDELLYKGLLLNYNNAKKWRKPAASSLRKAVNATFSGSNWYKIAIKGDGKEILRDASSNFEGMYKLDGATLKSAGVPIANIDPSTIQLFNNGGMELELDLAIPRPDSLIENTIIVNDGGDGAFGESDYILFYGRSLEGFKYNSGKNRLEHYFNHYGEENYYWLTWGKHTGKRIQTIVSEPSNGTLLTSFRDLAYFERESFNVFNSGMNWLDRQLNSTESSRSYTFNLQNVLPAEQTSVRFSVGEVTTGSQSFSLLINGNRAGSFTNSFFSSDSYKLFQDSVRTSSVLMNGNNTITITYNNKGDTEQAYTDWIEIEYSRELKALNNQLLFHGPANYDADVYFAVNGFTESGIQIFDVTDFSNIVKITGSTGVNSVSFAGLPGAGPKRYITLASSAFKTIPSGNIQSVLPANLRQPRTADFIIITYDDFENEARILKSLREDYNPEFRLETEVVKVSDVYNEFGCGVPEPAAIRDFLVYAQKNWGNPRYVLLFGDGHFDYKNIQGLNRTNFIPPFEIDDMNSSLFSVSLNVSRTTDDWYTYTLPDNTEMQMAIGRINVTSVAEARYVIEKIRIYETEPEYGIWKNTLTFVGDDEYVKGGEGDETTHTNQIEVLSKIPSLDSFNKKKIYLIDYPAVKSASVAGITKPLAKEAFIEQINRGSLLVNYVGHGNDQQLAHEKVLYGPRDIDDIQNGNRTALWIAATCEFAKWDHLQDQSLAEDLVNVQNRGAIAVIASSRLVYSIENSYFNDRVLRRLFVDYASTGLSARIGDAVMLAKQDLPSYNRVNNEKYLILGDPTMRIGAPRYKTIIQSITPDSIQALRKMTVTGYVAKDGAVWSDFNGKILVNTLDSPKIKEYRTAANSLIRYEVPGNNIFKGNATVTNGYFSLQFIVPKDISYNGLDGRITSYFWNDNSEGAGYVRNLVVGGTATNLVDHEGPEMKIHFDKPGFTAGDYVSQNPVLYVELSDSISGINTAADIGHQISLTLDDNENEIKDITDFFEYNEASFTTGVVKYPVGTLTEGVHTIKVKGWDNSNNSSTVETQFIVVADKELQLRNVVNYPNPVTNNTQFTFQISNEAQVEIKVYSIAGRLVKTFPPVQAEIGFNIYPEIWDGRDEDGDKMANGVYLYKIKAQNQLNGKTSKVEEISKLIIAR